MQDAIAIAVAVAAGLWLARVLWRQLATPACGRTAAASGTEGFVSLEDVARTAHSTHDRGHVNAIHRSS